MINRQRQKNKLPNGLINNEKIIISWQPQSAALGQYRDAGHSPSGLSDPSATSLLQREREREKHNLPAEQQRKFSRQAGPAGSSVTKAQLLQFHFLPSKMRKYAPFFVCNQWQMSVWPEDQVKQTVGCAIRSSIYGSRWEQRIKRLTPLPSSSVHRMSFLWGLDLVFIQE